MRKCSVVRFHNHVLTFRGWSMLITYIHLLSPTYRPLWIPWTSVWTRAPWPPGKAMASQSFPLQSSMPQSATTWHGCKKSGTKHGHGIQRVGASWTPNQWVEKQKEMSKNFFQQFDVVVASTGMPPGYWFLIGDNNQAQSWYHDVE